MKYLIIGFILLLSACTTSTEFGPCKGIGGDKDPKLEYKLSAQNLVLGFIFFELVAPPVVVAIDETFCPVGRKNEDR